MGLVTCNDTEEVKKGFQMVKSRGETLFKNSGVFIERYYPASHHIEVQIFGNGKGKAIHFGERECSIQRRHQKVIEEAPSPFVEANPGLREQLGKAAVGLAESIKYGSAGTVEYLVDDKSGDFFFLEMNTRLQVEHGITELCYDVDLVELMLQQADAQLAGKGGLDDDYLASLQPSKPRGVAIEARVYAENPVRDYAPSPGLLQKVEWEQLDNSRIDTWVFTGSTVTPNYDPLIAKVMIHARTRVAAVKGMDLLLTRSTICGPPTNLEFLAAIMRDEVFKSGKTITNFLQSFKFEPAAIDVISPGAYTLVQDLPGRPTVGKGIPHSGAMDPIALSLANMLAGNSRGTEGLEITLSGPELRFLAPAVVALTGAAMEATLDGDKFPMWTRKNIKAGQRLKIGKSTGSGCRAYLAVYGGFSNVADYFSSKSTSPIVGISGYQGRALAPGDLLSLVKDIPEKLSGHPTVPENLRPKYGDSWEIMTMPGPHDEGYLTVEDIEMLYSTQWKVSHNASRSAIRLIGPVPKWARKDGGEGGAHPSNLIEYGYPIGALNWTGDDPCIFPNDCPNFGGFISSNTVIRADWWKMGQMKAGDTLQYKRVSLEEALELRKGVNAFLDAVQYVIEGGNAEGVRPLQITYNPKGDFEKSVIWERQAQGAEPLVRYRQGGDEHLIVEYGNEEFNLNHRCRTTALEQKLRSKDAPNWLKETIRASTSGCTTLTLFYDGLNLHRDQLVKHLQALEDQIGDLSRIKVPCRRFKLPLSFESKVQDDATKRYMETTRPHAPYLPSNLDFVAKNNAFTPDQLKHNFLNGTFIAVIMGFFSGNTVSLPVDPRQRMSSPKANPSRTFTPEGTAGWGGSCLSIYPSDSPGGYMMLGQTIPCFDMFGYKSGFSPERPWLFQDFDLIDFERVSEAEMDSLLLKFRSGTYEWQWEKAEFDMAEHNKLLVDTADEVKEIRAAQAKAQEEMTAAETESLKKWRQEKAKGKVDESSVEAMLNGESSASARERLYADTPFIDPAISSIDAPTASNVWKVMVKAGDTISAGQTLAILEAMKMEINVDIPAGMPCAKVERVLVQPGEVVKAGDRLALLRSSK
jgi:urea carboxylase